MDNRVNEVHFLGKKRQLLGMTPKIGSLAPSFSGLSSDLTDFNSNSLEGTYRIYSVVPSVDTTVCALQTNRFSEIVEELYDVNVITISCDTPFALKRFKEDNKIDNMQVVSDQVSLSFGMKYGVVMEGIRLLARGVFVVDKDNILKYAQIVPDVHDAINFQEVLDFVENDKAN